MSEMWCTRLLKIRDAKILEKLAICAPSHNFLGYIFVTKKQQYFLHISSKYGELQPTAHSPLTA